MKTQKDITRKVFSNHQCLGRREIDIRESCGACMLNGYHDVEAGVSIPAKYRRAFLGELESENKAYAEALKKDIIEFGVTLN